MDNPIAAVRALLHQFQRSPLKSCHVVLDGLELFVSRDPAIRSPAFGGAAPLADAAPEAALEATHQVSAPHIATLVSLAPTGTVVSAGMAVGRLALLDETVELIAEAGGTVVAHEAEAGTLVEYGQPLVSLAA